MMKKMWMPMPTFEFEEEITEQVLHDSVLFQYAKLMAETGKREGLPRQKVWSAVVKIFNCHHLENRAPGITDYSALVQKVMSSYYDGQRTDAESHALKQEFEALIS
jgi:hypothetical protein